MIVVSTEQTKFILTPTYMMQLLREKVQSEELMYEGLQ